MNVSKIFLALFFCSVASVTGFAAEKEDGQDVSGESATYASGGTLILSSDSDEVDPRISQFEAWKKIIFNLPEDIEDWSSPIHCAAFRGMCETLKIMCSSGNFDVDLCDESGSSALFFAIVSWDKRCVVTLLNHGASLTVKNKFGLTPLDVAELIECDGIFEYLKAVISKSPRTPKTKKRVRAFEEDAEDEETSNPKTPKTSPRDCRRGKSFKRF
jgi:hypothetical protein